MVLRQWNCFESYTQNHQIPDGEQKANVLNYRHGRFAEENARGLRRFHCGTAISVFR